MSLIDSGKGELHIRSFGRQLLRDGLVPGSVMLDGIVFVDKLREPEGGVAAAPLQHLVILL